MIKIFLITWLIAIHAFAALAIWDTDLPYRIDRKLNLGLLNPPEITHYYEDMLGSHLQLDGSVENGSVIFLGDSLTQGLNVAAVANQSINYGIGMDTSYGLLKRVSQYKSLTKASTVVIAIGINDLIRVKRSPADVLEHYKQILDSLASDKKVIIQAVFPVDEREGLADTNEKIMELNDKLLLLAKDRKHLFINLQDEFVNSEGNLQTDFHIGDGLHLSSQAYKLWIQALAETLTASSR
jgi:lysophospholipase L1-like esterase